MRYKIIYGARMQSRTHMCILRALHKNDTWASNVVTMSLLKFDICTLSELETDRGSTPTLYFA